MPIPPTPPSRRVLILEDSSAVAETLRLVLSRQGHDVKVALSAEEAVEMIAAWGPDVAILDVMLPGMNGIEFAKILKAVHPACEIVLVSGHPGSNDLLKIAKSEGQLFFVLPKPLDPAVLVALAAGNAPLPEQPAEA